MALKDLAAKAKAVHTQTKELPFPDEFLRELDTTLAEGESRGGYVRVSLSPSGLGSCVRKLWYEFMGNTPEAQNVDVDSTVIANMGTATHDFIQRYWLNRMEKAGRVKQLDPEEWVSALTKKGHPIQIVKRVGNETKWQYNKYTLPLRGQCDGLLEFQGKTIIFEIKTLDTNIFRSLVKPMQKHMFQAVTYGMAFNLRYVLFLYVDRNGGKRKPFLLEITDDMIKGLEERIEFLHNELITAKGYDQGIPDWSLGWLPVDTIPAVEGDRCQPKYCGFVGACKATGDFPKGK